MMQTAAARHGLTELQCQLLERWQRGFPLSERPYAELAAELNATEAEVLAALDELQRRGVVGRIGAVVAPHRAGWSVLAALAVPEPALQRVAAIVSDFAEVNHNYRREHDFNLWFVVTAASAEQVAAVLADIERATGLEVLELPLERAFHIDLGFDLQWN